MFSLSDNAYIRLMRLDKPVGIWLLMWPCLWSVTLAAQGLEPHLLALFFIGAVLMRSAGCIVNDITDRKIDAKVERTKTRPLASGELSVRQAIALLAALLATSLGIAVLLGWKIVALGALWLPLVAAYPWMKRLTWWPQLFLGLTFNAGALFGWVAVRGTIELPAVLLYLGGICWTLGYDTIYAHQDKEDDAKLGVRSTALRFGKATKPWVAGFYSACIALLAAAGAHEGVSSIYYLGLLLVAAHFLWQMLTVCLDDPASCRHVFHANSLSGLLVFLSILLAHANY